MGVCAGQSIVFHKQKVLRIEVVQGVGGFVERAGSHLVTLNTGKVRHVVLMVKVFLY